MSVLTTGRGLWWVCHGQDSDSSEGAEDWERHEAMTEETGERQWQDVNRLDTERYLFEEEQETVWEKGGSGLVFHTDDAYWESLRGGFEERTADGWDLEPTEGRKARQARVRRLGGGGVPLTLGAHREEPNALGVVYDEEHDPHAETEYWEPQHIKYRRLPRGGVDAVRSGPGGELLYRMGWREGQPIGRGRTRILNRPIEVKQKKGPSGIGWGYSSPSSCSFCTNFRGTGAGVLKKRMACVCECC